MKSEIDSIRSEWETKGRDAFLSGFSNKQESKPLYLKSGDSMLKHVEGSYSNELKGASLGKILKGYITGDWTGAELEKKAMGESPLSSGGILLPVPVSAQVIDLARNQARVLQAGARVIPMSANTLLYPRLDSDVPSAWTLENTDIAMGAATFDSVKFTAHKVASMFAISNELLEDAGNIDGVLENSVAKSIALALDYAALYGTGVAPQPQGLHGIIPTVAAPSGTITYDQFLTAISDITAANFEPNAVIFNAAVAQYLAGIKNTLGDYLVPPPAFTGLQRLVSNQIPQGSGSSAFVGDWSELGLGLRASIQIEVSREGGYMDTSVNPAVAANAFSRDQTLCRATLRADWQVLHTAAFVELTGITG